MKSYWDSSALISAAQTPQLRARLESERGFSRRHALAETFSALTGKAHLKLEAGKAAIILRELSRHLDFIELSTEDILSAATDAKALGVRGGGIHDLLHARAALQSGAKNFLTLDRNDFAKLLPGVAIEQV
jgi:predicted nucleic acid-binding protein